MAQCAVDRAEERTTVSPPLLIGEAVGGIVETLVLPAIVTSQPLDVGGTDHRSSRICAAASSVTRAVPIWPSAQSPRRPPARGWRDRTAPCGQSPGRTWRGHR